MSGENIAKSNVPSIDGWSINIAKVSELNDNIVADLARNSASFMICTLNLDHLVKLRHDPNFREAYARASYVTADGFPVVWLARLSSFDIERTAGSDMIEPLCELAARRGLSIFLVGSTFNVLRASSSDLWRKYPKLDISGIYAPPRVFDPRSQLADEIIELIRSSGARICFVALGAPKQEMFCARAVSSSETSGICFLPIGAGLDFLAGTQRRAPKFLQRVNLEWAWRLAYDPRRLFKRYFQCALLFAELIARHYLLAPGVD